MLRLGRNRRRMHQLGVPRPLFSRTQTTKLQRCYLQNERSIYTRKLPATVSEAHRVTRSSGGHLLKRHERASTSWRSPGSRSITIEQGAVPRETTLTIFRASSSGDASARLRNPARNTAGNTRGSQQRHLCSQGATTQQAETRTSQEGRRFSLPFPTRSSLLFQPFLPNAQETITIISNRPLDGEGGRSNLGKPRHGRISLPLLAERRIRQVLCPGFC